MVYFITRDVAVVTDLWCLAQVWIRRASDERRRALTSTAFVSEEKETSARGRLVGIARAVHRRSRLRVSFSCLVCFPLVVVLWCVGNPDLWDRGLVCFWGTFLLWLVYPNLPIAWAQARARITICKPEKPSSIHVAQGNRHNVGRRGWVRINQPRTVFPSETSTDQEFPSKIILQFRVEEA